jgi:c-di-GMP-binding flagellar brake protein YcgR
MDGIQAAVGKAQERRESNRVTISVPGRYMLEDKREFPCRTIDFSPGGVTIAGPAKGKDGERVVVYLDYIGRIEGTVIRQVEDGFVLALSLPGNKREKIADQLTWLLNREVLGKADRRHDRIIPNLRHSLLRLEDGREHLVKLIDISVSGAGITTDLKVATGVKVFLGETPGRIIRHFDDGLAIEFDTPIPIEQFDEDIRL